MKGRNKNKINELLYFVKIFLEKTCILFNKKFKKFKILKITINIKSL